MKNYTKSTASVYEGINPTINFRYTTITTDRPVSKRFAIENGEIKKYGAMPIFTGEAEVVETDLRSFADRLKAFRATQVLLPGVLMNGQGKIRITTRAKPKPDHIPRVREHFKFGPLSLLPIDYDHGQFKDTQEFDAALDLVLPGFSELQRVYRKSNSCSVYRGGKQAFPALKFHCYILLKLSEDPDKAIKQINELGKIILVRAWNTGHGYCFITKSGSVIDRCLVDVAILGRPEGVMYEGKPVIGKGLAYQEAETYYQEGRGLQYLDISTVKPLSDDERKQFERLSSAEHRRLEPDVIKVRSAYEDERIVNMTATGELTEKEARQIIRSALDEKLSLSWPITLDSGETLIVRDLLDDPGKYEMVRMHDPLEPDYGRCKAQFFYNDGKNPIIHSLAHGLSKNFFIVTGEPPQKFIGINDIISNFTEQDAGRETVSNDFSPVKIDLIDELSKAFDRNEEGDALLIKRRFHGSLVYDHSESAWYRFKDHHWHRDDTNTVREIVVTISDLYTKGAIQCLELHRKLIEAAGPELGDDQNKRAKRLTSLRKEFLKRAIALLSESRAKKVLSWAAAGKPLGVTSEIWEADPWLLGVKNGVVDLRTGKLLPGKPDDYLRTFTPIRYDPQADCPDWQRFLLSVFSQPNNNDGLQLLDYFQKLLGYTLIGDCREAIFVILYGEGRNGKTTLLETIRYILGPYSFKANSELVLKKARPSGPGAPDSETLALRHRRFVYCSETEEGRRLDGNRVKHLCGNDCLTARGLYEKRPTEFLPTHTLYLMTNDKPQIRSDDFAIWQRIKPVPFLISFVDDPKGDWQKPVDKDMQKKLMAEAVGILTWLVDGCLLYQKEGLETPAIVTKEAQEYRSDESLLQQWAQEFCVIRQFAKVGSKDLFDSFSKYLSDNGHAAWSHTTFSGRLVKEFREYGIEKKKTMTRAVFHNIGLKE